MKHILFILDYYLPHRWWVETVFENIITRLLKKGYTISIITSHFDKHIKKEEHKEKLHIYRTWWSRTSFIIYALIKGIRILKKDTSIKTIHTSTYGGAIPASILWKIYKKKVILTVHEIFFDLWYTYKWKVKWWIYKCFEKLLFTFPYTIYHCVSRYTMNCIRLCYGIPDNKIRMIYNWVDTDFRDSKQVSFDEMYKRRSKHQRDNKYVLLYYWHTGKSKGIDYLIQALPKILEEQKDLCVVFNLIHAKRDKIIKKQIENCNWKEQIQIINGVEKETLRTIVASADCIIAPSISEWFWSVHTETVAMGKPLITTFIASIPEVVWGKVKFITPWSVQEIQEAIKEIRTTTLPEIPKKTFSREKTVEEIENLYS